MNVLTAERTKRDKTISQEREEIQFYSNGSIACLSGVDHE